MHLWLLPPLRLREAFGYRRLPHSRLADPLAILDQILVRRRSRSRQRRQLVDWRTTPVLGRQARRPCLRVQCEQPPLLVGQSQLPRRSDLFQLSPGDRSNDRHVLRFRSMQSLRRARC